jgi:hypothetical protein
MPNSLAFAPGLRAGGALACPLLRKNPRGSNVFPFASFHVNGDSIMLAKALRGGRWNTRRKRRQLGNCAFLCLERLEDRSLLSGGPSAFSYHALAKLGDPAPGGGQFINDFEPTAINERGQVGFLADLEDDGDPNTFDGEGVFSMDKNGNSSAIARSGDPAPGAGTSYSSSGFLFGPAINDGGDVGFVATLEPVGFPLGVNAGVFRFSHTTQSVTPVMLPGTPAPGGGNFLGAFFQTSLNNRGDMVFPGLVTDTGTNDPEFGFEDMGFGTFMQDRHAQVTSVVRPGDASPEGDVFIFAGYPWINDQGDVAFQGDLAGGAGFSNVYLKEADGEITAIAHTGDAIPGGGTFANVFGPIVNSRDQVVFSGVTSFAPRFESGVFLWDGGQIVPVVRTGEALPGGGTFVNAGASLTYDLNERGDVSFTGTLDTNGDGVIDATGLYTWSQGSLHLVARTGTEIAGVGTIDQIMPPFLAQIFPAVPFPSQNHSNDRGEILFTAAVDDGSGQLQGVLLVATPTGQSKEEANAPSKFATASSVARAQSAMLDDALAWWVPRHTVLGTPIPSPVVLAHQAPISPTHREAGMRLSGPSRSVALGVGVGRSGRPTRDVALDELFDQWVNNASSPGRVSSELG